MQEAFRAETSVAADGSFIFEDIDNIPDRTYIAVLDYQGMTFSSDFYQCTVDVPSDPIIFRITYYETTTSLANLRAERMHLFLDFSNPEVVQVAELFILNNSGNEIITATEAGGPVINIDLPAGAINLQFEGGELGQRFIQTEKGFADTEVINPGGGEQLLFGYELPYDRKTVISLPIPLDIDSAIIMLPNNGVSLKSKQLQETGARDVQGVSLALFTAANLKAGSTLELSLSGRPSAGISLETGNTTAIAIGAGALGVVLLGIGFWLLQQRKKKQVPVLSESVMVTESPDDLIDQIIALDDLYRSGNIPDQAYFSRRKELKDQLKEITE
jgi:LPXTG-motif cell wall-anchored protein